MVIVEIEAKNGIHSIESQPHRNNCWRDGYIEVPKKLEVILVASKGYCDLVIENGILKNIIPRFDDIPEEFNNSRTAQDDTDAMLIDLACRVALLESGVGE